MKNILVFFLMLWGILINGQTLLRDSILIDNGIYQSMYSEKLEQPLWVKYRVTCYNGKEKRTGMDFYTVKGYYTSDNSDYINNEWDKGHMAPAADFNCSREELLKTFSYVNCVLQQERLNRGLWRLLEAQERVWAKEEPITVHIKCIFKNPKKLSTGATIPTAFYKTYYFELSKKVRIFYFDNVIPPSKKTFWDYELK